MIYTGTSGYHYDDWKNVFYPPGLTSRGFLEFYAGEFAAVEINSSYYRLPSPGMVEGMCDRTYPGFLFVIKAFRGFTHEVTGEWESLGRQFCESLEVLKKRGRLGTVLFQFPYSFHRNPSNVEYLGRLLDFFRSYSRVVEFRNAHWLSRETYDFLRDRGAGFCCVDEPRLKGLLPPVTVATSPEVGYIRFHGRNAKRWWTHDEPWERYDYLYTPEELGEWVPRILKLAEHTEKLFIFNNNHPRGQAILNARMMMEILGEALEGEVLATPGRLNRNESGGLDL